MKTIYSKVLAVLIIFYTSVLSAATNEFVAEIVNLDIETGEVTMLYMHMEKMDFRLAYDVNIRLANGEKGAVANLRKGNQITAAGDSDKKVIYAIRVHN